MKATVVVPQTASSAKVAALQRSGAWLIQCGSTYDEAEAEGKRLAREGGLPFVSAYNDDAVIAGGGTVALEILEELQQVATLVVPAGGGGLISGVGVAAHGLRPEIRVVGVQSEASPALYAALAHGQLMTVDVKPSLADGLAGNVEEGSVTFDLLREHVEDVLLVSEEEIAQAMRWLLLNEHVLVEGSAAVGVAALLGRRVRARGPIGLVLSGRNVAREVVESVLAQ